jgi:hypothetical protein
MCVYSARRIDGVMAPYFFRLSELPVEDDPFVLSCCSKLFHGECLGRWFVRGKRRCPQCNTYEVAQAVYHSVMAHGTKPPKAASESFLVQALRAKVLKAPCSRIFQNVSAWEVHIVTDQCYQCRCYASPQHSSRRSHFERRCLQLQRELTLLSSDTMHNTENAEPSSKRLRFGIGSGLPVFPERPLARRESYTHPTNTASGTTSVQQ